MEQYSKFVLLVCLKALQPEGLFLSDLFWYKRGYIRCQICNAMLPKTKLNQDGLCAMCDSKNAECYFCNNKYRLRRLDAGVFGIVWSCWKCKRKGWEWL